MSEKTLTFKCACGGVQAKLQGEPFAIFNCHCHSCVASARFIDAKHTDDKKGTSGIRDKGSGMALYKPNKVEFTTPITADTFAACKVGDKGKNGRSYTKCCHTQAIFCISKFIAFNSNCLFNDDGSLYQPEKPIQNTMKDFAFEPSEVPEPKSNMIPPMSLLLPMMGTMMNPFGPKVKDKNLFANLETAEVVPITWEDKK